jgi:hypothetical protein
MKVVVRNEKGTDVNLASRLLHDAHLNRFDRAIVVSGDSDLVEPIRLVVSEIGKTAWVRNPRDKLSNELMNVATEYERIRPSVARESQLPDLVQAGEKVYHKPDRWKHPLPIVTRCVITEMPCSQAGCEKIIRTSRYQ